MTHIVATNRYHVDLDAFTSETRIAICTGLGLQDPSSQSVTESLLRSTYAQLDERFALIKQIADQHGEGHLVQGV